MGLQSDFDLETIQDSLGDQLEKEVIPIQSNGKQD
jgi:hypothetical protein